MLFHSGGELQTWFSNIRLAARAPHFVNSGFAMWWKLRFAFGSQQHFKTWIVLEYDFNSDLLNCFRNFVEIPGIQGKIVMGFFSSGIFGS